MRGKFGVRSPRQIPVLSLAKQPYVALGYGLFSTEGQLIGSTPVDYDLPVAVDAQILPSSLTTVPMNSVFASELLTYQWQRNSGGTNTWVDLPLQKYSSIYLRIPGSVLGSLTEDIQNGTQFRCKVICSLANTTPVTSSVITCAGIKPRATITTQLADRTIVGGAATFSINYTVTAPATGYGYSLAPSVIWYAKAPTATNFSVVTNATGSAITSNVRTSPYWSVLSLTGLTSANANTIYRAVIRINGKYVRSTTTAYWTGDTYLYSQDVLLLGS